MDHSPFLFYTSSTASLWAVARCPLTCTLSLGSRRLLRRWLGWQVGVHAVHWECRSLERLADGTVRDGSMCFSYTNEDVRTVAPSNEVDCVDAAVRTAQVESMRCNFFAGNLDVEEHRRRDMTRLSVRR